MDLIEAQELIQRRLRYGGSVADVGAEIIEPSPFSEDQRAALWLYARGTLRRPCRPASKAAGPLAVGGKTVQRR
jgi:hypothetical protein